MSQELSEKEREVVRRAFRKTSEQGWGLALGFVTALGLFVATVWLVVRGGPVVGPHLGLLSVYLPGYSVTWTGAFIGVSLDHATVPITRNTKPGCTVVMVARRVGARECPCGAA